MPNFVATICTAKRPQMLATALNSLADLLVPDNSIFSIVVIENDRDGKSLDIVERIQKTCPYQIAYYREPRIGIPFARNRAISAAISGGADWIAMIDDDESVPRDWLSTLYSACLRFGADVATGPVEQIVTGNPPFWWKPISNSRFVTGEFRHVAYTNNVLFSSRLVAGGGLDLKFDPRFIKGAEDIDFFKRAHDQGVRIVTVKEAKAIEVVPSSRLLLSRHFQRHYMVAASNSFFRVIHHGTMKAASNRLPSIIRRLLVGSLLVLAGGLLWAVARGPSRNAMIKGTSSIFKALGSFSGLFGNGSNYYSRIDGA